MKKKFTFLLLISLLVINVSAQWSKVTNGPFGGRVNALTTKGTSYIFVATQNHGIYRNSGGTSWQHYSTGLTSVPVSLFANTNIVYAGTQSGIFSSTNNGTNWVQIAFVGQTVRAIGGNDSILFAGLGTGIYKSTNGGTTWSSASISGKTINAITYYSPNFYAAASDGLYRTTDNGITWSILGLTGLTVNCVYVSGANLYAGTSTMGYYQSTNYGSSWTQANGSLTDLNVKSVINFAGVTIIGTNSNGIYKSSEPISSGWTSVNGTNTDKNIYSLIQLSGGSAVYAGTNEGILRTTDYGDSWSSFANGIEGLAFKTIKELNNKLFTGTDGAGIFLSSDNGNNWSKANNGLNSKYINCLTTKNSILFAGTSEGVFATTDDGANWTARNGSTISNSITAFGQKNDFLFAGDYYGYVYRTSDNGLSWPTNPKPCSSPISSIISYKDKVMIGTISEGVFISTNNGVSYFASNSGLTSLNVRSLAYLDKTIFAFTDDGIFKSTNYGANWVVVSSTIVTNGTDAVLFCDSINLYAGNYDNFFVSTDKGTSWYTSNFLGTKVSSVEVTDDYELFVGTNYQGMYQRSLSSLVPLLSLKTLNGGEYLRSGDIYEIKWRALNNFTTGVDIEYTIDNGMTWNVIQSGVAANSSYNWIIPSLSSNKCKIRVLANGGAEGDTSETTFTISTKDSINIELLGTLSDNYWNINPVYTAKQNTSSSITSCEVGTNDFDLTWGPIFVPSSKKIGFTHYESGGNNSGAELNLYIIPGTDSSLSGTLKLSNPIVSVCGFSNPITLDLSTLLSATQFYLRLTTNNNGYNVSKFNLFPLYPVLTLNRPKGGDTLFIGKVDTIKWTSTDVSLINLEYSTNNGSTWTTIANSVASSLKVYPWTIPNTPSTSCLVRISDYYDSSIKDSSHSVFSIGKKTIKVTSPNGGEKLYASSNTNIIWTNEYVDTVKIDFSTNGGTNWINITNTARGGTFNWNIPNLRSSQCKVRIISINDASVGDTSDSNFSILQPTVTVISPNGGEKWQVGKSYNISWNSQDIDSVKIEFTSNGGLTWSTIFNSVAASSTPLSWTIPDQTSSNCKIKISDKNNSSIYDTSDNNFTIVKITVVSPNGGEIWNTETNRNITWTAGSVDTIKIEYSINGGSTYINIASKVYAATGSYNWTIPYTASTNCKIKITDITDGSIADSSDAVFTILEPDREALKALYTATNGAGWTNSANWNSNLPLSSWYGITTSSNRVTAIDLHQNNLLGKLPAEIGNLTQLQQLLLRENSISDTIPGQIGNLVNLNTLSLYENQLSGSIPLSLYNLTNLETIELGYNQLTGTISNQIGNLINLRNLILCSNQLTGNFPSTFFNLNNLKVIDVQNNQLSGSISPLWGNLLALGSLYLSNNNFTGSIPTEFGNLSQLKDLYLSSNQLTGAIPSSIWNLTNLETISLANNQLTGTIQIQIGNLKKLKELWIGSNQLSGGIPIQIDSLRQLIHFDISSNNFDGIVPTQLNNLALLKTIKVNNNKFYDFPSVTSLTSLVDLYIYNNKFTFEDIESNVGVASTSYIYSPQDSVLTSYDTTLIAGTSYTLKSKVGGVNNKYQWYRNGVIIPSATDSNYTISNLTLPNAGVYTCKITNTVATALTLERRPITINVKSGLKVLSPNGGESWQAKSNKSINWNVLTLSENNSPDLISYIRIEFSSNNGLNWNTIVDSTPVASGSYNWFTPNVSSANCRIKITDVSDASVSDISDNVFTIYNSSILVTSPNGGELLEIGKPYNITWNATNTSKVKISYSTNNSSVYTTIVDSTDASTGIYNWTIPNNPSTQCRIKVADAYNELNFYDISDTFFTIYKSSITLTSPNGGEQWEAGTQHSITWTQNYVDSVRIDYSTNNGINWSNIVNSYPTSGNSYNWLLPFTLSTQCKIRILRTNDLSVGDTSNSVFTIFKPSITLTLPNGGEYWQEGKQYNITWTQSNMDSIKIDYTTNNGISWINISPYVQASSLLYQWIVPNTPANQCRVRLIRLSTPTYGDTSDNVFTIYKPSITVTSPNGDENWQANSIHTIRWNSTYVDTVRIDYSTDNGANWMNIASEIDSSMKQFNWTVPSTISNQCKVRVLFKSQPAYGDTSDGTFSIYSSGVTVTSPNGGEYWRIGTTQNITWTSVNVNKVKIEYSTNGGTNWVIIQDSVIASSESYLWTIPATPSGNCKIKISDAYNSSYWDISDTTFNIVYPSLVLTSPNGGENWFYGSYQNIMWTSLVVNNINIEYTTNNGTNWITIATNINSLNGSYSWRIPNTPTLSAKVRIYEVGNTSLSDTSNYIFTISKIIVTSPNGGENWQGQSTKQITWSITPAFTDNKENENALPTKDEENIELLLSHLRLELTTNNGTTWSIITSATPSGTGSFNWLVPAVQSPQCRVRLLDTADVNVGDTTDNVFSIYTSTINVTSPKGGENVLVNTNYNITWTSTNVQNVKIEYSTNNGQNWLNIISLISASNGSYSWLVPNTVSNQCFVKITDITNPLITDTSNSTFSISIISVVLNSPNGGENWFAGSKKSINYTVQFANTINIEYSTNSGSTWISIATNISPATGNYLWTVPGTPTSQAKIRIYDPGNLFAGDTSNAVFTISKLILTSPNGGEIWQSSSQKNITWSTQSLEFTKTSSNNYKYEEKIDSELLLISHLRLEYTTNDGSNWNLISTAVPFSNGNYIWTIPSTPSTQCKVRIIDTSDAFVGDTSDNFFTIYQSTITVLTPNGGERWKEGSTNTIRWVSTNVQKVKIEYSTNNGSNWTTIVDSIQAGLGSTNWLVPNTPSTSCRVKITDLSLTTVNDVSDSNFTIYKPLLSLISPNGGEIWFWNTQKEIKWQSNDISKLKIELTTNDGANWVVIDSNLNGSSGKYLLTVPKYHSSLCKIKISDQETLGLFDISDLTFTIVVPTLTLNSPNGGERLKSGTAQNINWNSTDLNLINLTYSSDNGITWNKISDSLDATTGIFNWIVPSLNSRNCRIIISSTEYPFIKDTSNSIFEIYKSTIVVVSPNGNEKLIVGKQTDVSWTYSDILNVKIELSTNNGITWQNLILSVTASQLKYSWKVSNTPSVNCLVRISDALDSNAYDISDTSFTISTVLPKVNVSIYQNPAIAKYADLIVISDSLLSKAPTAKMWSSQDTIPILMTGIPNSASTYKGSLKFDTSGIFSIKVSVNTLMNVIKDTLRTFNILLAKPGILSRLSSIDSKAILQINSNSIKQELCFIADQEKNASDNVYIYTPETIFESPLQIEINYDKSQYPDPSKLFIYHLENNEWHPLRSQVFKQLGKVKCFTNSLGKFKLFLDERFNGSNLVPDEYALSQNYPNPFNPTTSFNYSLANDGHLTIIIYNILGEKVKTLFDGFELAGMYKSTWDGKDDAGLPLSTGVFFVRMITENFNQVKKIMLLK